MALEEPSLVLFPPILSSWAEMRQLLKQALGSMPHLAISWPGSEWALSDLLWHHGSWKFMPAVCLSEEVLLALLLHSLSLLY